MSHASKRARLKKYLPAGVYARLEPCYHALVAALAVVRYGWPARHMRVIGVTGTNGKTTTCFMIHNALTAAGIPAGLMTTVAYGVGSDLTPQVAHMTTVSAPLLQRRLAEFRRRGVTWVVLEVTSHALAQRRIMGVPIEIAVMTNVTHEHLDYHGTFERYLDAKRRLFWRARRVGIINADDPQADQFVAAAPRAITYGIHGQGRLQATKVRTTAAGSRYTAVISDDTYQIQVAIPGEFNVANSLAALAALREAGLLRQQIEQGLAGLEGVDGRMTVVEAGQPFAVLVDFAHTPDSFERLLSDVRKTTEGRLIVLFGSAGRRDEAKRAIQGSIAGRYADELILTEEDDRDVDGLAIIAQIATGARQAGKRDGHDLFMVHDRTKAIAAALARARQAGDTVMLLGKGHEKTIERADGEHPWDEVAVARQALAELGYSNDPLPARTVTSATTE